MKGFQEMKFTLTKEQIKNQEFPEIKIENLTKEQAKVIAEILYNLICDDTINSVKEDLAS